MHFRSMGSWHASRLQCWLRPCPRAMWSLGSEQMNAPSPRPRNQRRPVPPPPFLLCGPHRRCCSSSSLLHSQPCRAQRARTEGGARDCDTERVCLPSARVRAQGQRPGPGEGRAAPWPPVLCGTSPLTPDLVNRRGARVSAAVQALTGCRHGMSLRCGAEMAGGSLERTGRCFLSGVRAPLTGLATGSG